MVAEPKRLARPIEPQWPTSEIDYQRRVHALFGIVFDEISQTAAVEKLIEGIESGRRRHLATPNANFLRTARREPSFREALLGSDLSTLDGMPLVWLARALGVRATRVAGADIFDALARGRRRQVRAAFFGGDPETSRRLSRHLTGENSDIVCVGAWAPEQGPIDAKTSESAIRDINASGADLLSVSIGAQNGVSWIARNERKLLPPVLANLGAVIHFATGAIPRAPQWMQRNGLEWAWRIGAEPALAQRYARDAICLARLVLLHLVPALVLKHLLQARHVSAPKLTAGRHQRGVVLALAGAWRAPDLAPLRRALESADRIGGDLTIDGNEIDYLDPAALGLILLAFGAQRRRARSFRLIASRWRMRALLSAHGCGFLLSPQTEQGAAAA